MTEPRHATQTLLNSSFHISSWCVQVIWSFYLLEPFFFFLKGNVLMLPIEIRGNKLLQDNNTWWVSASWGKGRPSSACDVERCLMLTSWLVPLIWCLSGAVICLPRRGKCGNLFVTFPYAERAQRRRGSFLWAVRSLFPLICFMGVLSSPNEKKNARTASWKSWMQFGNSTGFCIPAVFLWIIECCSPSDHIQATLSSDIFLEDTAAVRKAPWVDWKIWNPCSWAWCVCN